MISARFATQNSFGRKKLRLPAKKIADYCKAVTALQDKADLTPEELKDLYNKIEADKELSKNEPHHTETDESEYQHLLDDLQREADERGWGKIDSDEFGKENVDSDNNGDSNSSVDPNNNDDSNSNNDLTAEQIRGLTQGDISKLTPEQAAAYLEKLGIKDGGVIKDANNISVLLLLEKAGIDVKIAQNTHESVSDQWIQGKISGVQQDKDGKISYSVDCTAHGSQKNKYNFVQKEKGSSKYTVTVKEFGQGVKLADPDTASVEYEYDSGAGHLKRNGYRFTTEL